MNKFLLIIFIIFGFQSWTKADDISEFQLGGISIGDSLINHFSKENIEKGHKFEYPGSKKFFQINFINQYE